MLPVAKGAGSWGLTTKSLSFPCVLVLLWFSQDPRPETQAARLFLQVQNLLRQGQDFFRDFNIVLDACGNKL